jgi:hypothetical protein
MRFIVKNFGPLEEADVTLDPLTVFIGSNASGKSYLAYLIWSLLSVEPDFKALRKLALKVIKGIEDISDDRLKERMKNFLLEVIKNSDKLMFKNLRELLCDVFLVDDVRDLIREGASLSEIVVCNDEGSEKLTFSITPKRGLKFKGIETKLMERLQKSLNLVTKSSANRLQIRLLLGNKILAESYCTSLEDIFVANAGFIPDIYGELFDDYAPYVGTFIAPDGRAGLTRARESIMHVLLDTRRPVVMSAVDSEFMRFIETLGRRRKGKRISEVVAFIERNLGAEFLIQRAPPRYIVKIKDMELPLPRAPSGYREIAPIVWAIKYGIERGYILIIEEPEAHLHPNAETIITRALAGMSGLTYVLMTTHSISVLDEISNLIRLNKLNKEEKKELGYEDWEGLSPGITAIYCIHDEKAELLEIDEEGISESGLDRVVMDIANLHADVEMRYEKSRTVDA